MGLRSIDSATHVRERFRRLSSQLSSKRRAVLTGFHARLERIPRGRFKNRGFRLTVALILSVVCGAAAYQSSLDQAHWEWLKSNPPPDALWNRILAFEGFHEVKVPAQLKVLERAIPFVRGEDPRQWIARDRSSVVSFGRDETHFYIRGSSPSKTLTRESWDALGFGWEALNQFHRLAEEHPDHVRTKARKAIPSDQRMIVY